MNKIKSLEEYDFPVVELCVCFYLVALVEGFISMAVFAFSAAASAPSPQGANFRIIADI